MKLDLLTRLTPEEQEEIKRRVFTVMNQSYLDGITTGRELNREPLYEGAQELIEERISYMSNFFMNDDIWDSAPPRGYNPNAQIPTYDKPVKHMTQEEADGHTLHSTPPEMPAMPEDADRDDI